MGCLKLAFRTNYTALKVVYSNLYESENSCAGDYRYGFNGMEKDEEIDSDTYTAEFWEYDADAVHRWNIDPVTVPSISPYATFSGNPIWFSDPKGNKPTNYEDEKGNLLAKTNDGSDDVVTITDDKLKGFQASWKGTSVSARNSTEMNNAWKEYSGNNIKSDKLDQSTLGKNVFGTNYIGPDNPQTFPNAKGLRKWDYSASPVNFADASAKTHDLRYDKLGISGPSGVVLDTRAIGADWRFVGSQIKMAEYSKFTGDYKSAASAYTSAFILGLGVTGKTLIQLSTPNGFTNTLLWDNVTK